MYEGTQRAVARLREVADLFIVTSPMGGPNWTHEREEWLKRHFNISRANVAHISTKYIVTGDVFMDDKTSHLVEWRKHNPNGVAVRWDRLYNADDVWDGLHTDNWDVFLGIVMGVGAKLA
jgi:5'(3')-deoxyribonucleotidase